MEKELMKEAMHDACIRAVTEISADVKALVQAALDRETNETAKSMLSSMLENLDIAKAQDKAVCQSPGYPTTWISYGDDNFPSFAKDTIAEALGEATKKGYLRPSIVDPLTRHNPGNNTGKGVPNIEYQYNPGQDYVDFIISFKGCGAELGNAMKIFTTATLKLDKDFEGFGGNKEAAKKVGMTIGKKAMEEMGAPTIKRVGLKILGRGIARENFPVYAGDKLIGHTTSGTHCPYLGGAYAMAIVEKEPAPLGATVQVEIRGKKVDAEVVKSQFYKKA